VDIKRQRKVSETTKRYSYFLKVSFGNNKMIFRFRKIFFVKRANIPDG